MTRTTHPAEVPPGLVGEVPLRDRASLLALPARLEAMREEPATRVVLLDASAFAASGEVCPAEGLEHFPLPVVLAFNGRLAPTAFEVALAADIRVADDQAKVAVPRQRGPWASRRLAAILGDHAALRILLAGEVLDATAALASGFVTAVAPAGEALAAARRIAAVIASRGPIATQLGKEATWRGLQMPLSQALRFETDLTLLLQTTKDRAEGVRAFLEKRQPQFTGE